MESEKRNALGKLAEKINADRGIFRAFKDHLGDSPDEVGGMVDADLKMVVCILEALADVPFIVCPPSTSYPHPLEAARAVERCRGIAEGTCAG